MYNDGALLRAIIDGILAQRKLNGDKNIIATNDSERLRAIIEQGKRIETRCKLEGKEDLIKKAYKEGKA